MKICIGIGYPLKASRSPAMHNAGYKKLGIDNEFVYLTTEVKPENLERAIEGLRALEVRGISITMPFKQTVMKYLDSIDKEAEKIGAVNTIVNNSGKLIGYNKDWIGALTALEKKINLPGKKVAVIGAGGAARAIIYGLKKKNAIVKIFNRTKKRAQKLAQEFDCSYSSLNSLEETTRMDVIINSTSIGMHEDKSPIDKKFLNKNQIVFDVVYLPLNTKLIRDAKEKGAKVVFGYEMLLYQGIEQFKLYTNHDAPIEIMKGALIKSLNEN